MAESQTPRAEQIHAIAAQLLRHRRGEACRATVICAVSRGEGATQVAAALATAIAEDGLSTLLVDLDLGEPGLRSIIEPEPEVPGVAELLSSPGLTIGDLLQPAAHPSLMVIHARQGPESGVDLVGRDRFRTFIDDCIREFDFTVVDAPPANRSPDTMRIVASVGYAVIVARRDGAYMDDLAALARQIREAGATLLGSVLVER